MRIKILVLVLCGILSVKGSPYNSARALKRIDSVEKDQSVESIEKAESIDKSKQVAKEKESLNNAEPLDKGKNELVDSKKLLDKIESIDKKKPVDQKESVDNAELLENDKPIDKSESVEKIESIGKNKPVDKIEAIDKKESSNKSELIDKVESIQIEPVKKVESIENVESLESADLIDQLKETSLVASAETADISSSIQDSEEAIKNSEASKKRPSASNVIVQSTTIFQTIPVVTDVSRKIGPVELGLRNVVVASAVATEEIYVDMTAMNAETSHMINSKSEIMTAHTMNELFVPLNKIENLIKKTQECGNRYENALNMIFKDIDTSLKECSKELVALDMRYKSENVGTLTALSIAAEDMNNLPETCEIGQNFAVGTFCVINNLAEMNERVLSDVRVIKENTKSATEQTNKIVASTEICQKKLFDKVDKKSNVLLNEIDEKCVKRKP